jgi:hypothetical protein
MSIFTEQELQLLAQSCYSNLRLKEWLERVLVEGPGNYDWMLTAEGFYTNDQIPLFENILAEIEHQGTIYPATFVAVPVFCRLPILFPEQDHTTLLSTLCRIEYSRVLQLCEGDIPADILKKYRISLSSLVPVILSSLDLTSDETYGGIDKTTSLLALLALIKDKTYAAMLLLRSDPLIDFNTGVIEPKVIDLESYTRRPALSYDLTRQYEAYVSLSASTDHQEGMT